MMLGWWWTDIVGWWKYRRPEPIKRVRWSVQRARRGFSDRDWWNFDSYLARVIADACDEFRKRTMSYPAELTQEQWDDVLAEISFGFRLYGEIHEAYSVEREKQIIEELKKSGELLIKWFPALWD